MQNTAKVYLTDEEIARLHRGGCKLPVKRESTGGVDHLSQIHRSVRLYQELVLIDDKVLRYWHTATVYECPECGGRIEFENQ
jgi:hypothetical protein